MNRIRCGALGLLMMVMFAAGATREARAAAEVHRLNVVISGIPTEVRGGDFNGRVDVINRGLQSTIVGALAPLERIKFAWLFEGQLRYFVRPNVAVNVGAGWMEAKTERKYEFGITSSFTVKGKVSAIPVLVGGAYYLAPYNQGDFQARAYFGGGFLSLTNGETNIEQTAVGIPGAPSSEQPGTGDGPGYYVEVGGHMFFAARYSVLLSGMYRNAEIRRLYFTKDIDVPLPDGSTFRIKKGETYLNVDGKPFTLDLSGLGVRMAVAIGF